MRRSRSSAFLLLLALSASARNAQAQTTPAVEGGAFLLLPVGARATGLGQAAVADGGSTEALYWNPAGLSMITRSEGAIHYYDRGIFGTGTALVLALPASGFGVFTVGAYLVDYGEDEVRPGPGPPIGKILTRNVALQAAFATEIAFNVSAGIGYKLVQFRVDCSGDCGSVPTAVGTTHAIDVGVRYDMPTWPVTVGVALRHLGFKLQVNNQAQADPLPTRLVIGVAAGVVRPRAGVDGLDVRVLADVQSVVGRGGSQAAPMVGVDAGVRDVVRIRGGYAFMEGQARGPSVGLGIHSGRVSLDIARMFASQDDLGEREPMHLSVRLAL